MVIAVVGSGGKTTLIKKLAQSYVSEGKKVFVTTTTHMFMEENCLLTDEADLIIKKLESERYAMAGIQEGKKIKSLSSSTYYKVCASADIVLVEADGSKHMPLKYPASHEPVIPDNTNEIIVVTGLQAIGKPAKDVCHRLELVKTCLGIEEDTIITKDHVLKLLKEGYIIPLKKQYSQIKLTVHPVYGTSQHLKNDKCWILNQIL